MADAERPIPTYPDLEGKVAVVTGGSKGIGAACCRMLGANGVKVVVNGLDEDGVDAVVGEVNDAGGEAIGFRADVTESSALERMRERTESELGPVDILLPYAGGFTKFLGIEELDEDTWREVIDWNLTSTFLAVKSVLPSMIERRTGAIVTMASNAGRFLDKTSTSPYAASKAGIIQFTRHIAIELGKYSIRVNSIAPATVTSERVLEMMDEEALADRAAMSPLGRIGTPEDCAFATLFLVSDSAAWLTGITMDVTGGRTMI